MTATAYYTDGSSYQSAPVPVTLPANSPDNGLAHPRSMYIPKTGGYMDGDPVFYMCCKDAGKLNHIHPQHDIPGVSYDHGSKTLTLDNATINGSLFINAMGVLTIVVKGTCTVTGNINVAQCDMDVFIVNGNTDGTRATLNAPILSHLNDYRGTDITTFTMVGINYNAVSGGDSGYNGNGACVAAAFGFVDCAVNITNTMAREGYGAYGIQTSGNTYTGEIDRCCQINGATLYVEDCAEFNISAPYPVYLSGSGDITRNVPLGIKNSAVNLTSVDNGLSSSTTILAAPGLTLEDHAVLTLRNPNNQKVWKAMSVTNPILVDATSVLDIDVASEIMVDGIIVGSETGNVAIQNKGEIRLKLSSNKYSFQGIEAHGDVRLEGGRLDIDMQGLPENGIDGIGCPNLLVDDAELTVKISGAGNIDGISGRRIAVTNHSRVSLDLTGSESTYAQRIYGMWLGGGTYNDEPWEVMSFKDSAVEVKINSPGSATGIQALGNRNNYTIDLNGSISNCDFTIDISASPNVISKSGAECYGLRANALSITDKSSFKSRLAFNPGFAYEDGEEFGVSMYALYTGTRRGMLTITDSEVETVVSAEDTVLTSAWFYSILNNSSEGVAINNSAVTGRIAGGSSVDGGGGKAVALSSLGPVAMAGDSSLLLTATGEYTLSTYVAGGNIIYSNGVSAYKTRSSGSGPVGEGLVYFEGDDANSALTVTALTLNRSGNESASAPFVWVVKPDSDTATPQIRQNGNCVVGVAPAGSTFMAASYQAGQLLDVKEFPSFRAANLTTLGLNCEGADTVKLFLLNKASLAPLCDAKLIPIP